MRFLWFGFLALATLGSLYPFNFQATELQIADVSAFLRTCCGTPGLGDVIGNIVLFVPVGFLGMFSIRQGRSPAAQFSACIFVGSLLALVLQIAQIVLPTRDANLQDVAWNLLGMIGGALFAALARNYSKDLGKLDATDVSVVPVGLIGVWLIYRLIPFVPSLDLQVIKDSLKPLITAQWSFSSIVHDIAAWSLVAFLLNRLRSGQKLDAYLPVLILAVFCLEIVIVQNALYLSNLIGAMVACVIWFGQMQDSRNQKSTLIVLMFFGLVAGGLAPFELRAQPADFNWLPFQGFLSGSMYLNTQSAAEKTFLYGGLVYLLWQTTIPRYLGTLFGFMFVISIECAQIFFVGHLPDITDPILVLLAGGALLSLEHRNPNVTARLDHLEVEAQSQRSNQKKQWVQHMVNLRGEQMDVLELLARRQETSVSKLIRGIIRQFMIDSEHGLDNANESEYNQRFTLQSTASDVNKGSHQGWAKQSVNFRNHQYEFLRDLAGTLNFSISKTTRWIVDDFIEELDRGG